MCSTWHLHVPGTYIYQGQPGEFLHLEVRLLLSRQLYHRRSTLPVTEIKFMSFQINM